MLEIIAPNNFCVIPWKNGKGETIELAINEGGTIDKFDWRLSIASVVENGFFSDFTGYYRHLALIKGNGVELEHNNQTIDSLTSILNFAKFDGGCKTYAKLHSGPISDFNLMTKNQRFRGAMQTFIKCDKAELSVADLGFIYNSSDASVLIEEGQSLSKLPSDHLLKIDATTHQTLTVTGENVIFATVDRL